MKVFKRITPLPQDQKDIEFYAANINAWFSSAFEKDKSLLTLSSGAIGLLITLLSTIGIQEQYQLYFYIAALIFFLLCIGLVLTIFQANQKHIQKVINGFEGVDPKLKIIDIFANITFGAGAFLSILIGITAALHSNTERIKNMSNKSIAKTTGVVVANDSINGLSNLKPNTILQKSVNGASQLKPAQNQTAPNPATPGQNGNKGQ